MQVQGSLQNNSVAALRSQLVDMASRAGEPLQHRQEVLKDIEQQREDVKKDELRGQLLKLTRELNDEMKRVNTDINFNYSDDLEGLVVTVRDGGNGRIIREIPSHEAIELMKKMRDIIGNIFDKRA